jgi:cytochrome c-type biogenesis protein CcmH/NrfG
LQKVRQEPENSLWLMYLGDFLQSRKMERKAVDAYEKALQLTPKSAEINNNLAWLLVTAQDKAIRDPQRALALARTAALLKENGYIFDTLATTYWANGLVEEAVAAQIKAIRLDPDNRAYYQNQLEKFRKQRWGE